LPVVSVGPKLGVSYKGRLRMDKNKVPGEQITNLKFFFAFYKSTVGKPVGCRISHAS
jgi:hypothetical protein